MTFRTAFPPDQEQTGIEVPLPGPLPTGDTESIAYRSRSRARLSSRESFNAAFEFARQHTVMDSIARIKAINDLETNNKHAKMVPPGELNEMFPNMSFRFMKPTKLAVAIEMARRDEERQLLQSKIQAGPDTWTQAVGNFGAALAAHMMDPFEAGAGILAGPVLSGLGVTGATMTRVGMAGKVGQSSLARSSLGADAITAATENVLAVAPLEVFPLMASKQDNAAYGIGDAVLAVMGAGTAGAALKLSARGASRVINRSVEYFMDSEHIRILEGLSAGWAKTGKVNRVDKYIEENLKAKAIVAKGNEPQYGSVRPIERNVQYTKINTADPSDLKGHRILFPTTSTGKRFRPDKNPNIERGMGDRTTVAHGTTDDGIAIGTSADWTQTAPGRVYEMELPPGAKGVDYDQPFSADLWKEVEKIIGKTLSRRVKNRLAKMPAKHVVEAVPRLIQRDDLAGLFQQEINNLMRKQGNEYVTYTGGDFLGVKTRPHNVVVALNPQKLRPVQSFVPDASEKLKPSKELVQKTIDEEMAPSRSIDYEDGAVEALEEFTTKKPVIVDERVSESQLKVNLEIVKKMEALGDITKKQAQELREIAKKSEQKIKISEAATECVGGKARG